MWLYVLVAGLMAGATLAAFHIEAALILVAVVGALALTWAYAKDDLHALWADLQQFARDVWDVLDGDHGR